MKFDLGRVRAGEWIVGVASVALLLSMFLLPWYGLTSTFAPTASTLGLRTTVDGWNSLETLRWLILMTALIGIAALVLQVACRAPALPVCFTVIAMVLGLLVLLGLIDRVFINRPGGSSFLEQKVGGYAGLVWVAGIVAGGYLSLREDGIAERDAPADIERLRLLPRAPAS